jgi:hypothetical protein
MNTLPAHRRVINGRTYSQPWSASSFDPITHYRRAFRDWKSWALAAAIGVALTLVLVYGGRA